jgi:hypothetical protein
LEVSARDFILIWITGKQRMLIHIWTLKELNERMRRRMAGFERL